MNRKTPYLVGLAPPDASAPHEVAGQRASIGTHSEEPLIIVIYGMRTSDVPSLQELIPPLAGVGPISAGIAQRAGQPPIAEEVAVVGQALRNAPALFAPLLRASWRGQEAAALELMAAMIDDEPATSEQAGDYARALLYNGLGRYDQAVGAAERLCSDPDFRSAPWAVSELVEATARGARCRAGAELVLSLDEFSIAADDDGAKALHARSSALLSEGRRAEDLYSQAIELLDGGRALQLARSQLLYGEWLRRENRRVDARRQLRAAHDLFATSGAEGFAERARRELLATGETARRRSNDTRGQLTPQEVEIARRARDGLSNSEIGAELFISPRTVQYHLRKVFQKLNINSRKQLWRCAADELDNHCDSSPPSRALEIERRVSVNA